MMTWRWGWFAVRGLCRCRCSQELRERLVMSRTDLRLHDDDDDCKSQQRDGRRPHRTVGDMSGDIVCGSFVCVATLSLVD
jgi:hypothetical protein